MAENLRIYGANDPSPAIMDLAGRAENFMLTQSKRICAKVQANFVGSLLIATQLAAFKPLYGRLGIAMPERVSQPYELFKDVPVLLHDSATNECRASGYAAASVLVKHACGRDKYIGVVTCGPLAGLLLDQNDAAPEPLMGMSASRLWHDEVIHGPNCDQPEYPYFKNGTDTRVLDIGHIDAFDKGVERVRNTAYEALCRRCFLAAGQKPFFHSLMLFELCRELGIPVDQEGFHALRRSPLNRVL